MIKNRDFIIYGLFDPRDGQLRYIGRSSNGLKRAYAHSCPSVYKRQYKVYGWIRRLIALNMKPEYFIIEQCHSFTHSVEMEIANIAYFKSLGCNLCNLTDGGEGAINVSAESRVRISEASKGRKTFLGRHHSDETKKLLSEQRLGDKSPWYGKSHTAETKRKMSANSPKKRPLIDQFGVTYESQADAAKKLGVCVSAIEKHLARINQTTKGRILNYVEVSSGK